ncbi:hypothetical protein GNI_099250 [Gregarina niphandrodes]|uniref:Uncharacterized protein n=1 Tax=Gregarina niphandrodes TaxID=110365 RepID=A0A023B4Q4_GRENI|nr:hypothetical protein GNI_099250 [Gregarina niphandrodes]EZG57138.1 hypothetical protein GNI_099250 [Gregarina niphandrodes]|eukprot:XP_011131097.1 hypothetical protein GNI_099250 [Gregarina niphandrodes]
MSSISSSNHQVGAGAIPQYSNNPQIEQLFARLGQEVDEKNPSNPIFFVVDFLCKHYPGHLCGFASVWNANPELERDRLMVIEFFRFQKLPTEVASHFTNAGFDTLETLCSLTPETLDEIERFNQTRWLPGHKVRLTQTFSDIAGRVRAFRQEREKLMQVARLANGYCDHPTVLTRTNVPSGRAPAITMGPNPVPQATIAPTPARAPVSIQPGAMTGMPVSACFV